MGSPAPATGLFRQTVELYAQIPPPESDAQDWEKATEILDGEEEYVKEGELTDEGKQAILLQQKQLQHDYDIKIPVELAAQKVLLDFIGAPSQSSDRSMEELDSALRVHRKYQYALNKLRQSHPDAEQIFSLQHQLQSLLNRLGLSREVLDAVEYGDNGVTVGDLSAGMNDPVERLKFLNSIALKLSERQQPEAEAQVSSRQSRLNELRAAISPEQASYWQVQLQPTGVDLEKIISELEEPSMETLIAAIQDVLAQYAEKQEQDAGEVQAFLTALPPAERDNLEATLSNINLELESFLLRHLAFGKELNLISVKEAVAVLPSVLPEVIDTPGRLFRGEQYAIVNTDDSVNKLIAVLNENIASSALNVRFQNEHGQNIAGFQVYWHGPVSGSLFLDLDHNTMSAVEQPIGLGQNGYLPEVIRQEDGTQTTIPALLRSRDIVTGEKQISSILISTGGATFYDLPSNEYVTSLINQIKQANNIKEFYAVHPEPLTLAEKRSAGVNENYQQLLRKTYAQDISRIGQEIGSAVSLEELEIVKGNLVKQYSDNGILKDNWQGYPLGLQLQIEKHIRSAYQQQARELVLSGVSIDKPLEGIDLSHIDLAQRKFSGVRFINIQLRYTNLQGGNLSNMEMSGTSPSMEGADLRGANLSGATLHHIPMQGAQLQGANLQGSELMGLEVLNADFSGADFSGASVKYMNFRNARIDDIVHDQNTNWFDVVLTYEQAQSLGLRIDISENYKEHQASDLLLMVSGNSNNLQLKRITVGSKPKINPMSLHGRSEYVNKSLRNMDFSNQDFSAYDFTRFRLDHSVFEHGEFRQTKFRLAGLDGSNFNQADLRSAVFDNAQLRQSSMQKARLDWASLKSAHISGGDLRDAQLVNADLSGADLAGANLARANLQDADLRGADMYSADASYANFFGADLRGVDLRKTNITGVRHNDTTKWAGAKLTEEQRLQLGVGEEKLQALELFDAEGNDTTQSTGQAQEGSPSNNSDSRPVSDSFVQNSFENADTVTGQHQPETQKLFSTEDRQKPNQGYTQIHTGVEHKKQGPGLINQTVDIRGSVQEAKSFDATAPETGVLQQPDQKPAVPKIKPPTVVVGDQPAEETKPLPEDPALRKIFDALHPGVRGDMTFEVFAKLDPNTITLLVSRSKQVAVQDATIEMHNRKAQIAQGLTTDLDAVTQAQKQLTQQTLQQIEAKKAQPTQSVETVSLQSRYPAAQMISDGAGTAQQIQKIKNNVVNTELNGAHQKPLAANTVNVNAAEIPMISLKGKQGAVASSYTQAGSIPQYLLRNTESGVQLHAVIEKSNNELAFVKVTGVNIPSSAKPTQFSSATNTWINLPQLTQSEIQSINSYIQTAQQTQIIPVAPTVSGPTVPAGVPGGVSVPVP